MNEILDKVKSPESLQYQEELAKTYFSTTAARENRVNKPKTSTPAQPDQRSKKRRVISLILGIILVSLVAILVFNRVEIIVKVFPALQPNAIYKDKNADTISLSKDGEINRDIIKGVMFYEGAAAESSWKNGMAVLINEVNSKNAVMGIDFNNPVDMIGRLLCFSVKGKSGGEYLRICLKDEKNNLCYSKVDALQNSWQPFMIDINAAGNLVDPRRITRIEFEISPGAKEDLSRSTVYFKDWYFAKRRE